MPSGGGGGGGGGGSGDKWEREIKRDTRKKDTERYLLSLIKQNLCEDSWKSERNPLVLFIKEHKERSGVFH